MARAVWKVTTWENDFGCRIMSEHIFPGTMKGKLAAEEFVKNYDTTPQFFADGPELVWFEKKTKKTVLHKT